MSKKILMIVAVVFVLAVSSIFAQSYARGSRRYAANGGGWGCGGGGGCGGSGIGYTTGRR